jgi:hypothetical protein
MHLDGNARSFTALTMTTQAGSLRMAGDKFGLLQSETVTQIVLDYPATADRSAARRRWWCSATFMNTFPPDVLKHITRASVSSLLLPPCSEVSNVGGST